MFMSDCGTQAWLTRTNGRMGWRDRLGMLLDGVRAQVAAQRERRNGVRLPSRSIDELLPPDTPVTRAARAFCEAASAPWLVNHCLRSYLWARMLHTDGRTFDDEAMYVALLLHDLGLTERYRLSPESAQQCFTAPGAEVAHALATTHGWPDHRAYLVAEAITLHLNVTIAHRHGPEAWLVRAGSGADVAGLGMHRLDRAVIGAVVQRHPRLHLKRELSQVMAVECRAHPASRIAYLHRRLGFGTLVRGAREFTE
jgi:hypothetical protein